jgi:hypothetical protein
MSKLQFLGRGEIAGLRLSSAANKADIGAETIPFLFTAANSPEDTRGRQTIRRNTSGMRFPDGLRLEFGPFPVSIGRVVSPTARGWVNHTGYNILIMGEAEIPKALRAARLFGIPALQSSSDGLAQIDLRIAGSWAGSRDGSASGFSAPQVTGSAKLRNLRIPVRSGGDAIEVTSADMQLLPDEVRVEKLNAHAGGTWWTGSLAMPRGCGAPGACEVHFILNADQISFGELREWASPSPEERPWYRVLGPNAKGGSSFLANVRASGRVTADRLQIQNLDASGVSGKVSLDSGKLEISELTGNFLGGQHRGQWQADFSVKSSVCKGSGSLTGISLADVADAMKDGWIEGTASASYEVKAPCMEDFWRSADGTLRFDMKDGALPHLFLTEEGNPLKVRRFAGQARLNAGKIEIDDAQMDSADGKFQVSGTATLKGELDLKLANATSSPATAAYKITGTLESPHVNSSPSSETQAQLKAEAPK